MEFISSDVLINRMMETLSSFKNTGFLDEGKMYRWIQDQTSLLNLSGYNPVKLITKLNGNTLDKPSNYSHLWSIWKIEPEVIIEQEYKYFQHQHTYYKEEICTDVIVNQCMDILSQGQFVTTKYYVEAPKQIVEHRWHNKAPLKIFQKPDIPCSYSGEFRHLSSPLHVMEEKNKFEFNFKDEWIYMEYFGNLLDEDGYPMVPKNPVIEKSIEDYITWTFLKELFINGYSDVLQRMQYAEQQYRISHDIATSWKKTPSFMNLFNFFNNKNTRVAEKEYVSSRRIRQ